MLASALPTFRETITVYSRDGKKWRKKIVKDCAWSAQNVRTIMGNTTDYTEQITVRVPAGPIAFHLGDIVIRGEVKENLSAPEALQKYRPNAFKISTFRDNTQLPGIAAHYRLGGG